MSLLDVVVGGVVVSKTIKYTKALKASKERERRRLNTTCKFEDNITESEFDAIVRQAGAKIRRIKRISSSGPIVYGTVCSQSGISEWSFKIDFNDYGHITGKYWLSSDNDDSDIPEKVANQIRTAIIHFSEWNDDEDDYDEVDIEETSGAFSRRTKLFCPYCGAESLINGAKFCSSCGKKL